MDPMSIITSSMDTVEDLRNENKKLIQFCDDVNVRVSNVYLEFYYLHETIKNYQRELLRMKIKECKREIEDAEVKHDLVLIAELRFDKLVNLQKRYDEEMKNLIPPNSDKIEI